MPEQNQRAAIMSGYGKQMCQRRALPGRYCRIIDGNDELTIDSGGGVLHIFLAELSSLREFDRDSLFSEFFLRQHILGLEALIEKEHLGGYGIVVFYRGFQRT